MVSWGFCLQIPDGLLEHFSGTVFLKAHGTNISTESKLKSYCKLYL